MRYLAIGRMLVTGAAGMIGSAVIWELNRRGLRNILACDRLDHSEKWKNLVPLRFEDYFEADALVRDLDRLPLDIHTIFHLGACSSTTETDGPYLIQNNYEFTKTLAAWCLRRNARLIYASSAATYGALERNLSESRPLETLRPLNLYGYSKHLFDLYASSQGWLDRIVGLKYFNVFGPNEQHKGEMRSVVNKAFLQIHEGGKVKLFKSYRPEFPDGGQRRDFLYVKDAVKMTVHLAETDAAAGLFNIGSGSPHTWLELAGAIFAAMQCPERIEFIEMPDELRGKYQYSTCAAMERFHATEYNEPLTPLGEAVADYVQNYLSRERRLGDE